MWFACSYLAQMNQHHEMAAARAAPTYEVQIKPQLLTC
jgi:hypothetical protein